MPAASALGQPANPSRKQVAERLLERQKARYGRAGFGNGIGSRLACGGLCPGRAGSGGPAGIQAGGPSAAAASLKSDVDDTIGAARGQRYSSLSRPTWPCWRTGAGTPEAAARPSAWPISFAAVPCRRRWPPPARAAVAAMPRLPSSRARSRTSKSRSRAAWYSQRRAVAAARAARR